MNFARDESLSADAVWLEGPSGLGIIARKNALGSAAGEQEGRISLAAPLFSRPRLKLTWLRESRSKMHVFRLNYCSV
jgi:hypothetical protein